jgi:hypothetical protein
VQREEKEILKRVKRYCLYQYKRMAETDDFGEAGKARVLADFTRHFFSLQHNSSLSVLDIDRFKEAFEKIASTLEESNLNTEEINAQLKKIASARRLFTGVKKKGFPIVLFGPVSVRGEGEQRVYILEKEEARSPSSILPILALTTAQGEIVIRREQAGNRLDLIAAHELCHRAFSKSYRNRDFLALASLLNASFTPSRLEILNEMLAEWMPEECGAIGVLPYLARLAAQNYKEAKDLFYQNLADYEYEGKVYYSSVLPYIHRSGEIDFKRILRDASLNYEYYLGQYEEILNGIKKEIESALFIHHDRPITYQMLAKKQKEHLRQSNPSGGMESLIFKKYFWENMLTYLKNGAEEKYQTISAKLAVWPPLPSAASP